MRAAAGRFSRRVHCRALSPGPGVRGRGLKNSGSDCHIVASRPRRRALGLKNSEKQGKGGGGAVTQPPTVACSWDTITVKSLHRSSGGRGRWRCRLWVGVRCVPTKL